MRNSTGDKFDAEDLIQRYRDGISTKEERQLIESWYETIQSGVPLPDEDQMMGDLTELHAQLRNRAQEGHPDLTKPLSGWKKRTIAAAAVGLIALVSVFYLREHSPKENTLIQGTEAELWSAAEHISPGGNRATLTLSDGRHMNLSAAQTGIIFSTDEIRYADGSSVIGSWDQEGVSSDHSAAAPQFVISTPAGGTYQVILADGSKVWLNASSTLKYPARFTANEDRVVELEGEAYFEVAQVHKSRGGHRGELESGKVPFFVKTPHQTVSVLGTRFNVTAYLDESATITTLVEGSVKVTPVRIEGSDVRLRDDAVVLAPNQQSVLEEGDVIYTKQVDVFPFVSWKDGVFTFGGKTFRQVLAEIGRWYDLEIIYEGPVPTETFFGEAYRSEKLSVILKMLESTRFSYRLDDRKLIITGNQ